MALLPPAVFPGFDSNTHEQTFSRDIAVIPLRWFRCMHHIQGLRRL